MVGIHLRLDTTAPADATTLAGTQQSWFGLSVGLYRQAGTELQLGEENFFSDSPRGGSVRYEQGRLTLHFSGYDLDLHRVAGDKWSGRFHREDFDAVVTLLRPMLQAAPSHSGGAWFIGTWKSSSGPNITCLHIARQSSLAFVAWADTLNTWGSTEFTPQLPRPPYSWEHYGNPAKIQLFESGNVSIELGAYNATCCSHLFLATPARDGREMNADWPPGPNQAPHKSKWTKIPGDSCIAPLPQ
jgi:hypothetical protein